MKNTCVYHLCVSCKKGLMFRSRQDYIRFINNKDYIRFINNMALLAYKYHIRILAFAVMSNHYHIGIMTDDYEKFFRSLKVSYSNYYFRKYGVSLPRTSGFVQEAIGNLHIVTLIAYILRNPVHHGIVGHPFAYPYSSAGCYFSYNGSLYSIGYAPIIKRVTTTAPNEYKSNSDREGMIDPMTFVDFRMTETLFTSSGRLMQADVLSVKIFRTKMGAGAKQGGQFGKAYNPPERRAPGYRHRGLHEERERPLQSVDSRSTSVRMD